jgi:hypothetical protein
MTQACQPLEKEAAQAPVQWKQGEICVGKQWYHGKDNNPTVINCYSVVEFQTQQESS